MTNGKFAWSALLVSALALSSGCIISSDDNTVDQGVFHATWDVNGSTSGSECAAVGADKVSFLFTDSAGHGTDELFDCIDFAGDTNPLPLDNYTYVATLLDGPTTAAGCPGGANLAASSPLSDNFDTCTDISGGTCFADLPLIDFQL
jgi:hypothetical protein